MIFAVLTLTAVASSEILCSGGTELACVKTCDAANAQGYLACVKACDKICAASTVHLRASAECVPLSVYHLELNRHPPAPRARTQRFSL